MSSQFTIVKHFDAYGDMPHTIRHKLWDEIIKQHDDIPQDWCKFGVSSKGDNEVSDWFIENGAEPFETIVIEY